MSIMFYVNMNHSFYFYLFYFIVCIYLNFAHLLIKKYQICVLVNFVKVSLFLKTRVCFQFIFLLYLLIELNICVYIYIYTHTYD
jgi:hypothetical protein